MGENLDDCCFLLVVDEKQEDIKKDKPEIDNINPETDTFSCSVCDFITIDSYALFSHLSEHESSKENNKTKRQYSCDKCSFKPSSFKELLKHKKAEHPAIDCAVCKSNFKHKNELNLHIESSHKDDIFFACNQCNFKTEAWIRLKSHMNVHSDAKCFNCDVCGQSFKHSTSLSSHRKIHRDGKSFECDICGYKSKHRRNFVEHSKTHSEKSYTCDICGHRTKVLTSLKSHKRSHSDVKPHPCNQCDYRAKSSSNLKLHMKLHAQETPYCCHLCSYKTKYQHSLKGHIRKYHNEIDLIEEKKHIS